MALVARSIVASIGSTIILVSTGMLCAVLLHPLTGLPTIGIFLAFAPGGVAEMSLIALALSIDAALVATHHIVRIFLIVVLTPLLLDRKSTRLTPVTNAHLVCRLLLEKKKHNSHTSNMTIKKHIHRLEMTQLKST